MDSIIASSRKLKTDSFITVWNTANVSSGSSASNQIKLPLFNGGIYNFSINWGDGSVNNITSYNQILAGETTPVTHTYQNSGNYTIIIKGTISGFSFNNLGDKLKITAVIQWGALRLINSSGVFYGCANVNLETVIDVLNLTGSTIMSSWFSGCSSLIGINRLDEWNVSSITLMGNLFINSPLFNSYFGSWNTTNVTNMNYMLFGCSGFTRPLNTLKFTNVTTAAQFMGGKTALNYSASNYDALLIALAAQAVKPNISIGFGSIKRTAASTAARLTLTSSPNNWTIVDGGI